MPRTALIHFRGDVVRARAIIIARSLRIEEDDFAYASFNQLGGRLRMDNLLGEKLPAIREGPKGRLAA